MKRLRAVLFDVDFTLIYPGPTFQGEGYERFCTQHGILVDPCHDFAKNTHQSLAVTRRLGEMVDTGWPVLVFCFGLLLMISLHTRGVPVLGAHKGYTTTHQVIADEVYHALIPKP